MMNRRKFMLLATTATLLASRTTWAADLPAADRIWSGGPILTMDYRVSLSQALSSVSYYTSGINFFSGVWERQATGPFSVDTSVETMWAVVTPVPIPTALPLLASGLGALGFIGWRKKRKEKLAAE